MARRFPKDLAWTEVVVTPGKRLCPACSRRMHVKEHRRRRVYTLKGPVCYVVPLLHCPDSACSNHGRRFSPAQELTLAMPRWLIGWDVFCWLGHRRWLQPALRSP